jgi:hypothetical protein
MGDNAITFSKEEHKFCVPICCHLLAPLRPLVFELFLLLEHQQQPHHLLRPTHVDFVEALEVKDGLVLKVKLEIQDIGDV